MIAISGLIYGAIVLLIATIISSALTLRLIEKNSSICRADTEFIYALTSVKKGCFSIKEVPMDMKLRNALTMYVSLRILTLSTLFFGVFSLCLLLLALTSS